MRTVKNYRSAIDFHSKSLVGYEIPEQDTVISDEFPARRALSHNAT